jgi:hypothetical protein
VVPIWYGEHDRFACKRYQLDARRAVAGQRDEGEVEASLLDFAGHGDGAAHVSNLNGDSCVLGTKGGEDPDEVDRTHPLGLHRAEQDGSAQAAASFIYGVSRRLRCCQRGASFRRQRIPGVGQFDGVRRAIEQPRSEFLLEIAHTGGDG